VKRTFDVLVSSLLLLLTLPLVGLTAFLVCIALGRPIFFLQQRPGYRGRPFILYKFRTMAETMGVDGRLLPDGERLGTIGRLLRRTSLDELPELFNVLRGEMSLVGPRPLLMSYLEKYTAEQARRHEVRPGITGWAQINGRNASSWEDRFKMDVWYVDNHNLRLDLKILLHTVWLVFSGKGVNEPGQATREKFTGGMV
jgi:lipopolysaccharide/colanic/teichoic acid biosynthesis glycosyltransferase